LPSLQRSVRRRRTLIALAAAVAVALPMIASTSPAVQATTPVDLGTWSSMGVNPDGSVYALTWANNALLVGGAFTTLADVSMGSVPVDPGPYNGVARWAPSDGWAQMSSGIDLSTGGGTVNAIAAQGTRFYAFGSFLSLGSGIPAIRTARRVVTPWNASQAWEPMHSGLNGNLYAATVFGDDVIAAGEFRCEAEDPSAPLCTTPLNHVAKWTGAQWSDLADGVNSLVYAVAVSDDLLAVGGEEIVWAGDSESQPGPVAVWDGSAWERGGAGAGLEGKEVFALAALHGKFYAGGALGLVGSSDIANPVAVWDGNDESTWSAVESSAPGLEFNVTSLAADPEHGLLYVLGDWPTRSGQLVVSENGFNRIAVWDTEISKWVAMGPLTDSGTPPPIGLNDATGGGALAINGADVFVGCSNCEINWHADSAPTMLAKWTWSPPNGSNNLAARTGETVTITGEGFVGVTTGGVKFGSTPVPFTRSGTSEITVNIPSSLAAGEYRIWVDAVGGIRDIGKVVVTTGGGGAQPSPTSTVIQPSASPTPVPSVAPSQSPQVPGTSSMTIGGQEVQVQRYAQPRGRGVSFSGGPVTMTMRSTAPNGQGVPLAPDGSLVLARSGEVPIEASGLAPGSLVTQTLYSNPVDLGSTTANSAGDVRAAPTIPANTPLGSHALSIQGTTNTGDAFTFTIGVTVATPVVALGSAPVLDATLVRKHGTTLIDARARGVQARCLVTFTAGKQTARERASAQGVARATLPAPSPRSGAVKVIMRVSGLGCVNESVSTIARQATSR
jgi:IPT/TIG domain